MGLLRIRQIILLVIIFYSGVSSLSITSGSIDKRVLAESLILSFVALLIYVSQPRQIEPLKHQFFSISNLLVLSVFLVHFVEYLHYCVDAVNVSFLSQQYANLASRISVSAFSSLIFGLISPVKLNNCFSSKRHLDVNATLPYFFVFSIFVFIVFTGRKYFSAGGNSLVLNGGGMNPIGAVGNVSCIGIVIASVVNAIQTKAGGKLSIIQYLKCYHPLFWLCVLIYLALVFISGDRGPIIDVVLVLLGGGLYLCKIKVGYLKAFIILVIASMVLTIMSFFRGNDMELSIVKVYVIYNRFLSYMNETDFAFDLVHELSVVINTFHLILGYIDKNGFIYGAGIAFQILAFFPGIRSLLSTLLGLDIGTLSTDQLATSLLNEGIGAGTTCISDAYYNLGLVGTILFFAILGMFISKLDVIMYSPKCKTLYLVIALCFFARAIYIGRSTALQPINLVVYTSLYLYIARHFLKGCVKKLKI